jgi:hypothetical protein
MHLWTYQFMLCSEQSANEAQDNELVTNITVRLQIRLRTHFRSP